MDDSTIIKFPTTAAKKMSSLCIADLTQKKHHNVIRDIRSLIEQGAIGLLSSESSSYMNTQNKKQPMYWLDFEATMTLITGYDAKRRSQVISRWVELENKERDPMETLNDPASMRTLLLSYTEKVIALEETVQEQAPKVAALDRISTADGMACITDTAKTLQMRPKDLFNWLSTNKWIYRRVGGKGWIAYQVRIQQGVLTHKVTTITTSDGREKAMESVLVTPKGLAILSNEFSNGLFSQDNRGVL